MELKFIRFVYQVLVEGSLVIVLDNFDTAKQFATENYTSATILPVPVFEYKAPDNRSASFNNKVKN